MLKFVLIGRTNVGKSTFFNAVNTSRSRAIVYNSPGVTRDCNYSHASIGPIKFTIVDTPGVVLDQISTPLLRALEDADVIGLLVDGKVGIVPEDIDLAQFVRRASKPVVLLVNKCENPVILDKEYYKLGFGEPICISAAHKMGFEELYLRLQDFTECLHEADDANATENLSIAIVGRPNTGKSTFINSLLRAERLQVSEIAGTTRDSIAVQFSYQNRLIDLLDTAGMRKKTRIFDAIEKISTFSSIEAVKRAKVTVLMLDATEPLERQDVNILHIVKSHKKGVVIAINKVDLVGDVSVLVKNIEYEINRIVSAPIVYLSALKRTNINSVLKACLEVDEKLSKVISTSKLNAWLKLALTKKVPRRTPLGRAVKIKYCVCIRQNPMLVRLFCNVQDSLDDQYKSYLTNSFRQHFGIAGVPIEFLCTAAANPYAKKYKPRY